MEARLSHPMRNPTERVRSAESFSDFSVSRDCAHCVFALLTRTPFETRSRFGTSFAGAATSSACGDGSARKEFGHGTTWREPGRNVVANEALSLQRSRRDHGHVWNARDRRRVATLRRRYRWKRRERLYEPWVGRLQDDPGRHRQGLFG